MFAPPSLTESARHDRCGYYHAILTPPQRGKPRYFGLILTGVLLLALALAAALSTYYSVGSAPADISAVTTDVANNAASPEASTEAAVAQVAVE